MSRVPGTFRQQWALVPNPNYAGKTPRPLQAVCHDGSPCVDIRCRCGYTLHQHESQTAQIPADAEVASRCLGCGELLVFPAGWFAEAFARMRADGWIE
jgi:hypothetical protein